MSLIYMWMFVIVSSAEFVLCHREEHKTLLYITSNSLALDTSLIPEGQTFQSHAYSQLQATYSCLADFSASGKVY